MNKVMQIVVILLLFGALSSCDSNSPVSKESIPIDTSMQQAQTGRWYTLDQKQQGLKMFAKHCAACHGAQAQETVDWKTPTASGHYPPPPLNGTAHAWHHPLSVLQTVIRGGGAPMGGVMPAWGGVLSEEEITATIAAFQSYWSDEIYQRWLEIEKQSQQ